MNYIGIDVGGTNLAAGLVDETGRLLATHSRSVDRSLTDKQLAQALVQLARDTAAKANCPERDIAAVGVGVPGQADNGAGTVVYTPNMPFRGTPLRDIFQQSWRVPVYIGNDANCAAIGEYKAGAAQGVDSMVLITIGTGLGGGMVLGGKLFTGCAGSGMEVGHMVTHPQGLLCNCGHRGCWERYASATALVAEAVRAMEVHPESRLAHYCNNDPAKMNGRAVFDAAAERDETALAVLSQFRQELSLGLINLVNIIEPQVICLGGGVSNAPADLLLDPLRELVRAGVYNPHFPTRIEKASLGNNAGIVGAAFLCETV